jgi:hypothetical protein
MQLQFNTNMFWISGTPKNLRQFGAASAYADPDPVSKRRRLWLPIALLYNLFRWFVSARALCGSNHYPVITDT